MRNHTKRHSMGLFLARLKSIFLHGFFTLLPITVTIFIVHFTYSHIAQWLRPLRALEPMWLQKIPGSEFVLVTLVIFLIGLLLKILIIVPIEHSIERIFKRIPLVRSIYSASKTLVDFFNVPDNKTVQRKVVLIEFPCKGYFHLAFLLGEADLDYDPFLNESRGTSEKYAKIFMPHSPNPTSGYFFIIPSSTVVHTNISFEEAIKTIVSCGLITPDTIARHAAAHRQAQSNAAYPHDTP